MNFNRISLFAAVAGIISFAGIDGLQIASAAPDQTLGMALMSAVVYANGTLAYGSGAITSSKIATGNYEVTFDRDVTGCTYTASGGGVAPGQVYLTTANVTRVNNMANEVEVITSKTSDGMALNSDFHLIVFCSK